MAGFSLHGWHASVRLDSITARRKRIASAKPHWQRAQQSIEAAFGAAQTTRPRQDLDLLDAPCVITPGLRHECRARSAQGACGALGIVADRSGDADDHHGRAPTTGLFVAPIHQSTGVGIAAISFALAIGQFVWGAVQPVFGAIADKHGSTRVLIAGGLMLAAGTALTPFMSSQWGLMFTLGLLTAAGAGAGSFSS